VRTRLIRVDWNEKRIGLSLRGIPQPSPETADVEGGAEEVAPEQLPELASPAEAAEGELAAERLEPEDEPDKG